MALFSPFYVVTIGTVAVFSVSAFNIDLNAPRIFNQTGFSESFFGYKLQQFQTASETGVVVGAPLQDNGTGGVFICSDRSDCMPVPLPTPRATETDFIKGIGMTIAARREPYPQFTACSPAWSHECDGSQYLNSICYQWNNSEPISNITPAFTECTKQNVDLVFLFDGSKSMKEQEFNENKKFIKGIMKSMQNTSIQFAAVQFSFTNKLVFTFKDFRENKAEEKLDNEKHMSSLTNTYGALAFVLENLFENPESGRHHDATKVLVIITDGNPTDDNEVNFNGVVTKITEKYETLNIIRFVIAVGERVDIKHLKELGLPSEPKDKNIFYINDYAGLTGLLSNLQTKIFNIEGSKHNRGQSLTKELSQSGISAEIVESKIILGSVGFNNWKGSLLLTEKDTKEQEIQDSMMKNDSYMGYSVAVGKRKANLLFFTGAPRYNHQGRVIVFGQRKTDWEITMRVDSEQVGSYFGAELCAVDIDSDDNTDFLMVGAPMHHSSLREGRVYVYRLTDVAKLVKLRGFSESTRGRFGSSIAPLRDLNGDGYMDLAVGAPLADESRGAVYIYLGHKEDGIRPKYSQRISAKAMPVALKQFGVTISGKSNVHGLTEIAVGSRGNVVMLRSRPVLSVSMHLSFSPSEISTQTFDCVDSKDYPAVFTLAICFKMKEKTNSNQEAVKAGLKLGYNLVIDAKRTESRGFLAANNTHRKVHAEVQLKTTETCLNSTIYMHRCVTDLVSPVTITVSFSQLDGQQQPYGVLDVDSKTEATLDVPFEKSCGHNDTCVADLKLDFNFTSSSLVVFGDVDYLYVKVKLANEGDNSYNTRLLLHYPNGLSLFSLDVIQQTRPTHKRCDGQPGKKNLTVCSVSPPVFSHDNWVVFNASFYLKSSLEFGDFMSMTITAHSDNGDEVNVTKSLPVLFAASLAVTFLETSWASTTDIEFFPDQRGRQKMLHIYRVANLGRTSVPITVDFTLPTKPGKDLEILKYDISHNEKNYTISCSPNNGTSAKNCSETESCETIRCHIPTFAVSESILFTLSVDVLFNLNPNVYTFTEVRHEREYRSFAEISYNKMRYIQTGSEQTGHELTQKFDLSQGVTRVKFIVPIHMPLIIGLGSSGGLLLLIIIFALLYKCGFFKRQQFGNMDDGEEGQVVFDSPKENCAVVPSPEAKSLMSAVETTENGSTSVVDNNNSSTTADTENTD